MAKRDEFERAQARGQKRKANEPFAVGVRYDRRQQRVILQLNTGLLV